MKNALKKRKKAIVSVTNDLVTDQRVHRVCLALLKLDFRVLLVGRKLPESLPLEPRGYSVKRMWLFFRQGPLFYAEYNLRLLLLLLSRRCDVLVSNDLDTLLPNYIASRLKSCHLVYDSHEYFTGVPELSNAPFKRSVWKKIEKSIFPYLDHIFTVNESIAELYKNEYGKEIRIVRNIPLRPTHTEFKSKKELGIPGDKKIILLQGAGINVQRGAEEAVLAMRHVQDAVLLIIGGGDVFPILKKIVMEQQLNEKVIFISKIPYHELLNYTHHAGLGLSLDKGDSLNYRISLPNKIFDYIHSGVPILASPLPEVKKIIEKYQVGDCIENHDPVHIASKINAAFGNENTYRAWKENTLTARLDLSWEKEEKELIKVYSSLD